MCQEAEEVRRRLLLQAEKLALEALKDARISLVNVLKISQIKRG
ncbi:Uncharacterised protein [Dermatophilus congolensis]|uniref:Uncharacterized protein n=1 Tax=Dermatophilus congolensis TaxID=1863 RepID=A0A239V7H5_9MICO|nr:Uncharacterised protein [Dermatophilus congolensis]